MYKPESFLENENHKILCDLEIQTDHQIQARRPDLELINKKKITCHQVNFALLVDHKRLQKAGKYLDLARELKKLWNLKVTVIPIVVEALGIVLKVWKKDWESLCPKEESRLSR